MLTHSGYQSLTLDAIAHETGSSRPAINRRFGGKQGLVEGFVQWIIDQIERKFVRFEETLRSPLATLRAGAFEFSTGDLEGMDPSIDPTNQLQFFAKAWLDPDLRPLMVDLSQQFERSIARLLADAVAGGEMHPCEVDDVAHILTLALLGVAMQAFTSDNTSPLLLQLRAFDAVLRPYLTASGQEAMNSLTSRRDDAPQQ